MTAALLIGLGLLAGTEPGPARPLRVLCYNIHHGEGTDGKLDLGRIAGVIKAAKPDLVALQEVERVTARTGKVDQAAELGRLTGLHAAFEKAIDFRGGGYGLAILSRRPLKGVKSHRLPGKPGQEQRIVMEATVGPGLILLNTHLQHDDGETRVNQVARINELYGKVSGTLILAGDMNAAPGSTPVEGLARHWTFATPPGGKGLLTIPSAVPRVQIDYILYRPACRFKVTETRVIEEKVASDHRPVLAILEPVGR